jgi:hypothetical protein
MEIHERPKELYPMVKKLKAPLFLFKLYRVFDRLLAVHPSSGGT